MKKKTENKNEEEEIYKKVRQKKVKDIIKRSIIELGDVPIFLFMILSSMWVAVSTSLYVYSLNYPLHKILVNSGGGHLVIMSFSLLTLFMFFVWLVLGSWCIAFYKAHVLVQKKEKKRKTYIDRLMGE